LTLNGGTIQVANTSPDPASLGYYKSSNTPAPSKEPALAVSPSPPSSATSPTPRHRQDPGFIDLHRGLLGDANDDGVVNFADFTLLSTTSARAVRVERRDFNGERDHELRGFRHALE